MNYTIDPTQFMTHASLCMIHFANQAHIEGRLFDLQQLNQGYMYIPYLSTFVYTVLLTILSLQQSNSDLKSYESLVYRWLIHFIPTTMPIWSLYENITQLNKKSTLVKYLELKLFPPFPSCPPSHKEHLHSPTVTQALRRCTSELVYNVAVPGFSGKFLTMITLPPKEVSACRNLPFEYHA